MEFLQLSVGGSPAEALSAVPAQWHEAPPGEDISLVAPAQPSTEAVSALPTIAETAPSSGQMSWKDPRFPSAIEAVRKACNVASDDWEDDPMIGMLLDRLGWKHDKVVEAYNESVERRRALGTGELRAKILSGNLGLDDAPFAAQVRAKMVINASVSLNKAAGVSGGGKPGKVASYDVIGSYELRYGHSSSNGATSNHESSRHSKADKSSMVTAAQFTEYMVYVTVWRWLQLELYIRRHGELGFWSMIHDISCPEGYMALWSRFRNLLNEYMPPVNEACDGLYPQMVQKILIINSPRFFGAAWVVISAMLPQHQKEKIVLLTTSQSNTKEMSKYMPEEHMPPHIKAGNSDGPG